MSEDSVRRILVVDDNPDDRAAIVRHLRKQTREYRVEEVATGEEALDLLRRGEHDCAIMDYYLTDMTGNELLRTLRGRSGGTVPLPILMVTGQENDEIASEALTQGAQDYLVKDGLSGATLARAIENAIEKFRIQRELTESRLSVELRNHKLAVLRDQLQDKVDELAQATNAKDQFMAVMSHEMRTPLNAIIGYSDLLEMELDAPLAPSQREKLERIQVGSRHLLELINDVLDLARADAGKLNVDVRPVDVGAVLEEVVALLEREAREKGIGLEVEKMDRDIPNVAADLNRFRQIITNLIGNAIKFTERGDIHVRCFEESGKVCISVADTGIGIEAEVLPLVFSEFYQASGELTREKGGSGLGLAISQRLAALMDATIDVTSSIGEGSTFTLRMEPAEVGAAMRGEDRDAHLARMQLHAARSAQTTANEQQVTVVAFGDESESLRELERQVLPGVRLIWSTNADEVEEIAARERAALVVLDIACADGAAWKVARTVQDNPALSSTAILLLPSIPSVKPDEITGGLDLGWLSLVPKPFTADQLHSAISTAANRAESSGRPTDTPLEVLVVDDDPDSRRVACKFLTAANLRVREAADGESGLMEMHRKSPDIVVLDLMMPVLDGFGVLATMRADPALAGIPVVVLTAKSLTEAERHFLARTAVRVLQKGEHRLADVASLVTRAASRARPEAVQAGEN